MKRRTFLKQLSLAATLPLLRTTVASAADVSVTAKASSHKVLSCNVRVDVPGDSKTGDGWQHRRDMCTDIIKAQKADLIGLQEAQNAHVSFLKSRMAEYDVYALSHSVTEFHPINAIFFLRERYELISAGGFWISETPHVAVSKSWDSANPRIANWVDLRERGTGNAFRYWNTHLDHKGQKAREKGAEMIVQASSVLPATLPQLLTGDMNAQVQNPAIKHFKDGQWIDTYETVHGPKDPGFTAHAFKGTNAPTKGPDGADRGRIDWIFVRGPVKATGAAVIRDGRDGHWPSDHFFVSAEVSF
jgi:endonuclease/exonuclease/phosphatase family metal-dependent hydrolase